MTALVTNAVVVNGAPSGANGRLHFTVHYQAGGGGAWTTLQTRARTYTTGQMLRDTFVLSILQPGTHYQFYTEVQLEYVENGETKYQTIPAPGGLQSFSTPRFKVVTEVPTGARFDAVTLNATFFTPVPNPLEYPTEWQPEGSQNGIWMQYGFDYSTSPDFPQDQTWSTTRPSLTIPGGQSVALSIADSARPDGLSDFGTYYARAMLEVLTEGQGMMYYGNTVEFLAGNRTAVWTQGADGTIEASAKGNGSVGVEYGYLIPLPQTRVLFERTYSNAPWAHTNEVRSYLTDTGSQEIESFSETVTTDYCWECSGFPPLAIMAFRGVAHDAGSDTGSYYPWDPRFPGMEWNAAYTLVTQWQKDNFPIPNLLEGNLAIQDTALTGENIVLSAVLTNGGEVNPGKQVEFFWGTNPNALTTYFEPVRLFLDTTATEYPPMVLVTTEITPDRYRPYTTYYYNMQLSDNPQPVFGGQPAELVTASVGGVAGGSVQVGDDLTPSFSAQSRVNDGGGTLHFEYGTTTAYGSSTTTMHLPKQESFLNYVTGTIDGGALQPHTLYHARAVMYDSATAQTHYGQDFEFLSSVDASLGTQWFVQGMNGVQNTFSFTTDDPAISTVSFIFEDENDAELFTVAGINQNGTWRAAADMGELPPQSHLRIVVSRSGEEVLNVIAAKFGMIPNPGWLPDDYQISVDPTSKIITYSPNIPLPFPPVSRSFPSGLKFMANYTNSLLNFFMPFEVDYNIANHTSKVVGPDFRFELTQAAKGLPIRAFLDGKFFVDDLFRLDIDLSGGIVGPPTPILAATASFNFEDGLVTGDLSCGITAKPVINWDFLMGSPDNSGLELIKSGDRASYVVAGLDFFGGVTGNLSVADGVGSVNAQLGLDFPVLLGVGFATDPHWVNFVWGGDMSLKGELWVKAAGITVFHANKKFYDESWGTIPAGIAGEGPNENPFLLGADPFFTEKGSRLLADYEPLPRPVPIYSPPSTFPMPSIAQRDSNVAMLWADDTRQRSNRLLLSMLQHRSGEEDILSSPVTVVDHAYGMSDPKGTLFADGSVFVTWTQSRYDNSYSGSGLALYDYFSAQDIWGAFYDADEKRVIGHFRFEDDSLGLRGGRIEGKPEVATLDDSTALVAWIAGQPYERRTNVHYSIVTAGAEGLRGTSPAEMASLDGTSRDVRLGSVPNGDAVAVWINNPNDPLEERVENRVLTARWNGAAWEHEELLPAAPGVFYRELDLAFNDERGVLAVVAMTQDSANGGSRDELLVFEWDVAGGGWSAGAGSSLVDTGHFLLMPEVAISERGVATVIVQRKGMYLSEEKRPHLGDVDLFVRDLNGSAGWLRHRGSPLVGDSAAFEWELEAGFGDGNTLMILTQENDLPTGNTLPPANGVRFGVEEQAMVLRAVRIGDGLGVEDAPEPLMATSSAGASTGGAKRSGLSLAIVPNPVAEKGELVFGLPASGRVTLRIVDAVGREVALLLDEMQTAGRFRLEWNASNLPAGAYRAVITAGGATKTIPIVVSR